MNVFDYSLYIKDSSTPKSSGHVNYSKLSNYSNINYSITSNDFKIYFTRAHQNPTRQYLTQHELDKAYQIHLNKCKKVLSKRLNNIPTNTMDYKIWDEFMQTSMNNISLHIIKYLDSLNDILSLLCCSKTTYDSIGMQLLIEHNNNKNIIRIYSIMNISKRDPNTFELSSFSHSDIEYDAEYEQEIYKSVLKLRTKNVFDLY